MACRAAVYGALVPADQFQPQNGPDSKKGSLGRANAANFLERLCKYPGNPEVIKEAERHILEAHAQRLTEETGHKVTREDIEAGKASRPKILDMFAGGGAIPLEALRLGCEAHALDLNPVAYIILLCTLVYPQKYGKPDPNARGMTGPVGPDGNPTWGGLAKEVRYWGEWVLKKVKAEIGDLYPLIPDPEYKGERPQKQQELWLKGEAETVPPGYLMPVAYLWTRTVTCKNPACGATVPLVRQTWLCKKKGRYVAMKMIAPPGEKQVRFEVVEAVTEKGLGFDPADFSSGGNATCPFCGTVADSAYVKAEGCAKRIGQQMMAVVCTKPNKRGKIYLSLGKTASMSLDTGQPLVPPTAELQQRLTALCLQTGLTVPSEPIEANPRSMDTEHYGFQIWGDLFTIRQLLCILSFAAAVREAEKELNKVISGNSPGIIKAIVTYLGGLLDKILTRSNTLCPWDNKKLLTVQCFGRQALPMLWDFAEANPLARASGAYTEAIEGVTKAVLSCSDIERIAEVSRGSAISILLPDASMDAVITDPPYYDNVSYSNLSDFFYIWLKRTIGHLYPKHFATTGTPKKSEIIAAFYRHGGDKKKSRNFYEHMMAQSFREAQRVLKPGGAMVVVYAHKTTIGWATLVEALRQANFTVMEAWPVATEGYRLIALNTAALASSIFLVVRKRNGAGTGSYEDDVRPELEQIVRERVQTLWDMGITGADLVIAAVGAGLRAFTRFAKVEYANGEEVPAERFLAEVETVVLESILQRLSKEVGGNGKDYSLAGLDPASRFYILWRYTYKYGVLEAGEAIIFANGTHVELEGPQGLSTGARALLEKAKGKYRLRDFRDRGEEKKLGLRKDNGEAAPLIDALHRVLWLMDYRPTELTAFLQDAQPNKEQLRLVAQALAGPALKGGELADISPAAELSALAKLTANWKSLMEEGPLFSG